MRNLARKPRAKSEDPVKAIVIGVIIALVAGGSSPWWWGVLFPKPAVEMISRTCFPEVLRDQLFRAGQDKATHITTAAKDMRTKLNNREFECVSSLATVVLDQDHDNGHGLYFEGETWRAKAADPTQSWFCREKMREYFLKYIANERDLPLSERDGDSKVCYEREKGYCSERTAWINHLMAADYYQWAEDSKDKDIKQEFLQRAAKFSNVDLAYGGFDDGTPSGVLRDRIKDKLQQLAAPFPRDH